MSRQFGGYVPVRPFLQPTMVPSYPQPPRPLPTSLPASLKPDEKPQTTVYVGKIPPTVDDEFMKKVLSFCGFIKSWKRAHDPTTNAPKGFGFCEYETPEGALRALRLLNKFPLDNQELVLNVTQVTRDYLERYVTNKKTTSRGPRLDLSDLKKVVDLVEGNGLDEEGRKEDEPVPERKPKSGSHKEVMTEERRKNLEARSFGLVLILDKTSDDSAMKVIHQIVEERAAALAEAAEKEKAAGTEEGEAPKEEGSSLEIGEIVPEIPEKVDSPAGEKVKPEKVEEIKPKVDSAAAAFNNKEEKAEREADRKEKHTERMSRDLERIYLKREMDWEAREKEKARERKDAKEWMKEKERDRRRLIRSQEEFSSSDSEDEWKHSSRYYEEQKRRRFREVEEDDIDRVKEEEEAEEAKKQRVEQVRQIAIIESMGIGAAVPRAVEKAEEIPVAQEGAQKVPEPAEAQNAEEEVDMDEEMEIETEEPAYCPPVISEAVDVDSHVPGTDAAANEEEEMVPEAVSPAVDLTVELAEKQEKEDSKKKLGFNLPGSAGKRTLISAFGAEDDEENKADKKRTLVPIDYGEESANGVAAAAHASRLATGLDSSLAAAAEFARKLSQMGGQDKSKPLTVKSLIDSLPKTKEEVFSFNINWSIYDKNELKQKLHPWVTRKIEEYLGAKENTLVEVIMSKINGHVSASEMLEFLEPIFDAEAETFAVKIWRAVIFEVKRIETGLVSK